MNPHEAHCGVILQLGNAIVFERLSLVLPDQIETGPVVRRQKCSAYRVPASFHRDGNFQGSIALAHALIQAHANVIEQMRSLAVNEEFQLLAGNIFAKAEVSD